MEHEEVCGEVRGLGWTGGSILQPSSTPTIGTEEIGVIFTSQESVPTVDTVARVSGKYVQLVHPFLFMCMRKHFLPCLSLLRAKQSADAVSAGCRARRKLKAADCAMRTAP